MIYSLAIVFSIVFIIFIIALVRNNKLQENYSILWIIFSSGIVILSIFPNIINIVANALGVQYQPSILYLFTFFILAVYIIHLSIVLTKQNKMIVKLTQELGILKEKVDKNVKENKNEK